jgi:hypothetical protein
MASIPYVNSAALRTGENGNSSAQLRRTESALGPAQAEEGPMTVFVYATRASRLVTRTTSRFCKRGRRGNLVRGKRPRRRRVRVVREECGSAWEIGRSCLDKVFDFAGKPGVGPRGHGVVIARETQQTCFNEWIGLSCQLTDMPSSFLIKLVTPRPIAGC